MKNHCRKTKVSALRLAAFVLCLALYVACSKEKETVSEATSEFVNPMNIVGEYHNKGLEYCINKLPNSVFSGKSVQDTVAMITSLIKEFRNSLPSGHVFNNDLVNYEDLDEKVSKYFIDFRIHNSKSAISNYSDQQKEYIKKLEDLLKHKEQADSVRVFKDVSKLEYEIFKSHMTNEEKNSTLLAAAVGKYSWKFWSSKKLTTKSGLEIDGELRDIIIRYDIEGALAGAIAGCIGGAIVGSAIMPGVGTLTACIIEAVSCGFQGAIIGSCIGALSYLIFD